MPWGDLNRCEQEGCQGHLAKFSNCRDEALWLMSLDGGDETTGTVDFEGHYTLIILADDESGHIDGTLVVTVPAGFYIVESTDSGAVYVHVFYTEADARKEFEAADERYSGWLEAEYEGY